MHKISLACVLTVFLIGCGGGSGGSGDQLAAGEVRVTLVDGFTLAPLSGIKVRLDASGQALQTNDQGVVLFFGTKGKLHDIHVIPKAASGYGWDSSYQVGVKDIYLSLDSSKISYVTFSGRVNNFSDTSQRLSLLMEDRSIERFIDSTCQVSSVNSTYQCVLTVQGAPAGQQMKVNLWAMLHSQADRSMVNGLRLQDKRTFSVTTQAAAGQKAIKQDITFTAPTPKTSTIGRVLSVTQPNGVNAPSVAAIIYNQGMNFSPRAPANLNAYNPFPQDAGVQISAFSINGQNSLAWAMFANRTVGSTDIRLQAAITGVPSIKKIQGTGVSGASITWQPATGSVSAYTIDITDLTGKTLWSLSTPAGIHTISLPVLQPDTLTPLQAGASYNIEVVAVRVERRAGPLSYDEGFTNELFNIGFGGASGVTLAEIASSGTVPFQP